MKNATTPATATKDLRGTKWSDNAISFLWCNSNDMQQALRTALFSSGFNGGHGIFVNPENLWQAAVIFSVRQLVQHTWVNHNDQFLQPTVPLSDEFKIDCLIWMLFHGKNLTASANNLEWNGKKWSIVNHFIPYTEAEVNAPERFESDFMVQYLADLQAKAMECVGSPTQAATNPVGYAPRTESQRQTVRDAYPTPISSEAQAVLDAGRVLWQAYFAETDVRSVRDELKLNRADVGWYQIRNALKARNASGDNVAIDFKPFETAYKTLTDKLQPQVFELGFLRV